MKPPSVSILGLAVLAGVELATPAIATINIAWVPVGNAGNAADTTGYGRVDYAYNIGKYEVTNSQYVEFLNAKGASNAYGIYNSNMESWGIAQTGSPGSYRYAVTGGLGERPVVYVSWFDGARFSNWLGNGQGDGDTESGAYTLGGATSGIFMVNSGATVYLPSEDQWYKAAYYNGITSTYSLYPNGQNTITKAESNYGSSAYTNVGTYSGDPSSYGTFDQGGNVFEWNDAVIAGASRGRRGGSWGSDASVLQSSARYAFPPAFEVNYLGFRVASVPEPSCMVLTIFASGTMFIRRKR